MNLERARFNMIEQQIRPWDVFNQTVLDAFRFLPREKFVPPMWHNLAYADIEIPLGHGESMMYPKIEARMLQELAIRPTDHCLEIGTGSGFVTACMAHLGQQVDSVEIHLDLSRIAASRLEALEFRNVELFVDDASRGWKGSPDKKYDVIAVTGSIPEYFPPLEQRLATGGRLFVVLGRAPAMHAVRVTRTEEDGFERTRLFETRLKPLTGADPGPDFRF
ncbi:MAG: protein-L-isoaspartate O-methyltransferase [Thiothrix sp.]|nr:protein-L-isoaspartate O-methyltransferase [Thiothrix sp.]HPQ94384.1 protein-L-isoaspartate O-methyltransferase [Thiolinea sp.]